MKLKSRLIAFAASIVGYLLPVTSCGYKSDDTMAKEFFVDLTNAIVEKDEGRVRSLFAPNIINAVANFDKKMESLISYVTGDLISRKYNGTGAEYTIDNMKQQRLLPIGDELITSECKFYFTILYCCIDDFDSNNKGIWNLMVQKCKNEDDAFIPYSSYEEWKHGTTYRGITLL